MRLPIQISNFKFLYHLSNFQSTKNFHLKWSLLLPFRNLSFKLLQNFCINKHLDLEMLGKYYSTTSKTRPASTALFVRALPTSLQCVPIFLVGRRLQLLMWQKTFLRNPAHPAWLNIDTLQNLSSCFHSTVVGSKA